MAQKKTSSSSQRKPSLSFEAALAQLEQIVQKLEDGRIGLDEALKRYEEGVKCLKHCHLMLQQAERKIAILRGVDDAGTALTDPLDEETMSLEEKADNRSRRRRPAGTRPARRDIVPDEEKGNDMDQEGRLF